jgi:chromosome segregation ATPase
VPKFDKPLSGEELDEIQQHCEAIVQDDPRDSNLEQTTLRLLHENTELRQLLRAMQRDEAQKTITSLVDANNTLNARIKELEQLVSDKSREAALARADLAEKKERVERLETALTTVMEAARTFTSTFDSPEEQEAATERQVQSVDGALSAIASNTGELTARARLTIRNGRVQIDAQLPKDFVARAVPRSKKNPR